MFIDFCGSGFEYSIHDLENESSIQKNLKLLIEKFSKENLTNLYRLEFGTNLPENDIFFHNNVVSGLGLTIDDAGFSINNEYYKIQDGLKTVEKFKYKPIESHLYSETLVSKKFLTLRLNLPISTNEFDINKLTVEYIDLSCIIPGLKIQSTFLYDGAICEIEKVYEGGYSVEYSQEFSVYKDNIRNNFLNTFEEKNIKNITYWNMDLYIKMMNNKDVDVEISKINPYLFYDAILKQNLVSEQELFELLKDDIKIKEALSNNWLQCIPNKVLNKIIKSNPQKFV